MKNEFKIKMDKNFNTKNKKYILGLMSTEKIGSPEDYKNRNLYGDSVTAVNNLKKYLLEKIKFFEKEKELAKALFDLVFVADFINEQI